MTVRCVRSKAREAPSWRQRGVIRHSEIDLHHLHDRAYIHLYLSQRKTQQGGKDQGGLNGQLGKPLLLTGCRPTESRQTDDASSDSHPLTSSRRTKLRSYAGQFWTQYSVLGMRCRSASWNLKTACRQSLQLEMTDVHAIDRASIN